MRVKAIRPAFHIIQAQPTPTPKPTAVATT